MKRDLDLVRKILFKMEEDEKRLFVATYKIDGYSPEQISYHMKIMAQAGLLHMDTKETDLGSHFPQNSKTVTNYYSISWQGHEFLSAIRDDTTWNDLKKKAGTIGGFYMME